MVSGPPLKGRDGCRSSSLVDSRSFAPLTSSSASDHLPSLTSNMSEPSETNEAAITDEPKWANGDVTLISSDNVRFKVSSELLAWGR